MDVLIIDDDHDVRGVVQGLVASYGHASHAATCGVEGFDQLTRQPFDVIICDIRMPGLNGLEFLARVRALTDAPPVILLSAYVSAEMAMEAVRLGAFDYLIKPVDESRLRTSLLRIEDQKRLQEELQTERLARARSEAVAEACGAMEKALRESERRYRAVVEDLPALVCRFRAGGTITFVNDNYCRYFGRRQEDLLGTSFLELVPEKDRASVRACFESLTSALPSATHEHRVIDGNGKIMWQRWTDRAIVDEAGYISEYQSIGEDITEYKLLQEHVRHVEKMQAIGQLAAGVAHEINNPIGYIKSNLGTLHGYAKTLLVLIDLYHRHCQAVQQGDMPEQARLLRQIEDVRTLEDIDFICSDVDQLLIESREGAERVRVIVKSLKSFARADEQEKAYCNLIAGIESTLRVVWNELKYHCEVVRDFAPLPDVRCNIGQLNQVFMNLLMNAAHAIPERGTITVSARMEGDAVVVRITDTGHGIPPEHLPRIFEPFFTTKDVGKGTGLGLSISHGIVTDHGGTITVESEPGAGATFTVRLPVDGSPVLIPAT